MHAFKPRTLRARIAHHAFMVIAVLISVGPLYAMLATSLHSSSAFAGGSILPPAEPTFENYTNAWNNFGFAGMFKNSLILSVSSAVIATGVAAAAAFGMVRYRFRGKSILIGTMIALMAVPPIVIIVPLFIFAADLRWIDTYQAGILAEVGIVLPFATVLLYSYMKDLPGSQFEAAAIDGAGPLRQFWHVALPLSRPALVTTAVILAIYVWNDLIIPLVVWPGEDVQTLMVGLAQLGPGRSGIREVPLLMASVTITVIPLVALYLLTRRMLARGLMEGGQR